MAIWSHVPPATMEIRKKRKSVNFQNSCSFSAHFVMVSGSHAIPLLGYSAGYKMLEAIKDKTETHSWQRWPKEVGECQGE